MDAAKLIEDARAFASELSERGNSTASKWLERAMAHRNGLKWKDDEEDKAEGSYRMSKDYEALWMHLEAGGEALGRMNHPDSSPRFPVIEPTDIRPLHVPFWQALMTSGRQTFTIVCQQRQLEWLAPSPDTAVNDQPQCTRR